MQVSSLLEGIQTVMALFYIFNIRYPKDLSLSCEFLQRQMLRIRLGETRGSKKSSISLASCHALMVAIHDIVEEEQ
jgi:hypothetical protein